MRLQRNIQRSPVYPCPSLLQCLHLTQIEYNIKTKKMTSAQSAELTQSSPGMHVLCVRVALMQLFHVLFMYRL